MVQAATRPCDEQPTSTLAGAIAFDLVATRAGFDALEGEWNRLHSEAARGPHVFQSFNWLWHWANHFAGNDTADCAGQRLQIVTARRNGHLVLVWPLVSCEGHFIRQVGWMGEPASQYGDVLMADLPDAAAVLSASWTFLLKALDPDVVHLRKVRADATVAPLLAKIGARLGNPAEAPFLDLGSAPSARAYEERYPAKARKNRRRLMRRLDERARVEICCYREGPAARELAELAVALKRAWLRDRGIVAPALGDDRLGRMLADACGTPRRPTGARVSVLRSGGEPASIEIGFESKGTLALHLIVYALKFEKTGAGVLHLEDGIRCAFEEGHSRLDLLAPAADYKMDWADGTVAVADHTVTCSARGQVYAGAYLRFARTRGKALVERLPAGLRRVIG